LPDHWTIWQGLLLPDFQAALYPFYKAMFIFAANLYLYLPIGIPVTGIFITSA
jgi:hypothetical protein